MTRVRALIVGLTALALGLGGCATPHLMGHAPEAAKITSTRRELIDLPPPPTPVTVAVYGFADQTGQFKPTDSIQTLSRALSQGSPSILVQALRDAGGGHWFDVLEREHLEDLLKERQVITEMRQRYLGEKSVNPDALPSLMFAGVLLEGGVVGYDSDTLTGGAGARLLGIGGSTQYRQDTITVYLRAVAVKTGEVLASVVVRKTVASVGVDVGAFRYVSYKSLLETEAGLTTNEPEEFALEQAIGKAVHDLVLEGARRGVWTFNDRKAASAALDRYAAEMSAAQGELALAGPNSHRPLKQN